MAQVSVIGAGAAGLATAALLARDGHSVDVFEKNAEVGGRIGRIVRDGFRFDTGPSWYLMPEVYDHFFALMGTSAAVELDLVSLDPAYTVFTDPDASTAPSVTAEAAPVSVPLGRDRVVAVFEDRESGAGRRLQAHLRSAAHAKAMAERLFLYNPFTSPLSVLDRSLLPSIPSLARLLTESLSRRAERTVSDPRLRQILQYPAVFLGTDPRRAPAIYHLMSALDLDEGVDYPMGGFRTVVDAFTRLAERAGVRIHTSAEVEAIETETTGRRRPRVTGVTWTDARSGARRTGADIVVSAADLHHTQTRLLPPALRGRSEDRWSRMVSGPGAVLVFLGVTGDLPQLPHHSLFFTPDWTENFDAIFGPRPRVPHPASLYVCRPSATDPTVAPPGCENLFALVPVPADAGLGGGGPEGSGDPLIERAADRAIAQIAEWADIPDLAERIVVRHTIGPTDFARDYNSWLGGMLGPAHTLRQSAMFRTQNASRTVDGLYFAGATTAPGVGVPMCLISAELVLKHIRGDSSPGPLPAGDGV
ncbi:phytoene desaturase family protein [Brevibacterium casei]|uniref:phytoene desaturase family protein n=1 Tax=Brevibacterium casei TaxID=33889 RepID=UPI0021B00780|nr:phytoene desaturase family protein [Brevibacterium casei]MCT1447559.1 phytoene desaturase family protein [Brevibacterium casei]